jgi:hypothetical protein
MQVMLTAVLLYGTILVGGLDVKNEAVKNSPGLYYQHESAARLYNSEWKIVTYLNLQQASDNVDIISG